MATDPETTREAVEKAFANYERHAQCPEDCAVRMRWLMVRALLAEREARDWQPMATAPKDGTPVLVWDGFDCMVSKFIEPVGWHSEALCAEEPTHWQPLPKEPTR